MSNLEKYHLVKGNDDGRDTFCVNGIYVPEYIYLYIQDKSVKHDKPYSINNQCFYVRTDRVHEEIEILKSIENLRSNESLRAENKLLKNETKSMKSVIKTNSILQTYIINTYKDNETVLDLGFKRGEQISSYKVVDALKNKVLSLLKEVEGES